MIPFRCFAVDIYTGYPEFLIGPISSNFKSIKLQYLWDHLGSSFWSKESLSTTVTVR